MKKYTVSLICAILCVSALLAGCGGKDDGPDISDIEPMDLFALELDEYVMLGEYKGLTISLQSDHTSRADAIWQAAVANSRIIKYPEGQVEYYLSQSKQRYSYMAKQEGIGYEDLLQTLSLTEESLRAEAESLTRDDLVLCAIIKAEGISLGDAEKTEHFDRYVQKYVSSYGYREEYVRENMTEQIYSSMLHDKALEYLILQNEFNVIGG